VILDELAGKSDMLLEILGRGVGSEVVVLSQGREVLGWGLGGDVGHHGDKVGSAWKYLEVVVKDKRPGWVLDDEPGH
jgi:hypothetical protein